MTVTAEQSNSKHEKYGESHDPRTGKSVGEFELTNPADMDELVASSRVAGRNWASITLKTRVAVIRRAYHEFFVARDELALTISKETGKPLAEAYSSEVLPALDCFKYYIKNIKTFLARGSIGAINPLLKFRRGYVRYEPLGVVAVISPWNYPLLLAVQHIVPAILCGNAVVHKPSEYTTLTGLKILEVLGRASLPGNVLTVVTGFADVGRALVQSNLDKIFFVGSTSVGLRIYQDAANSLVPVNMELGGSDAMIVLEDAPFERAIRGAVWGAFCNAGQACVSVERLLVHDSIYDKFVARLVEQVHQLKLCQDDPSHGDLGCLVNQTQFEKIQQLVDDARRAGATIRCGGKPRPEHGPLYYEPTVITDTSGAMAISRQEIFGPIVVVTPFGSDEEAVSMANNSEFGLSSSVWTRDRKRGEFLAEKIEAGSVLVNDGLSHLAQFEAPYSGYKNSGLGTGHGPWGILEMVHAKYVSVDRRFLSGLLRVVCPPLGSNNVWWFKYGPAVVDDLKAFANLLHAKSLWTRLSSVPRATKALFRRRYLE